MIARRWMLFGLATLGLTACTGTADYYEPEPPGASMPPSPYAAAAFAPPPPPAAVAASDPAASKAGAAAPPDLHDAGPPGDPDEGKAHYKKVCQPCHQADGKGLNGMLAANLAGDPKRLAKPDSVLLDRIMNGYKGDKLTMPPQKGVLTEEQIKDALAYVRTRFGKK